VLQATLAQRVHKVKLDQQAQTLQLKVLLVRRVIPAQLVRRVILDQQALSLQYLDRQVQQATPDQLVRKVFQVLHGM
jgi:hypothetical protein